MRLLWNIFNPRALSAVTVGVSSGAPSRVNRNMASPLLLSQQQPGRTVRAGRRRPSGSTGSQRERADAPQREQPGGGGMPPSFGGGGGLRPGGMFRGGRGGTSPLMILAALAILVCLSLVFGVNLFGPSDEAPAPSGLTELQGTEELLPTIAPPTSAPVTRAPTRTRVPGAPANKWTILLYQDADDKILEQDIYFDVNEAERIGSTDQVQIVAQIDRFRGGYLGDGNWNGTRRYYVTQDQDLRRLRSELVEDLGEVNMSAGESLVDFVTWGIKNYPADKYVLIMSDHGMGWPGGWSDAD